MPSDTSLLRRRALAVSLVLSIAAGVAVADGGATASPPSPPLPDLAAAMREFAVSSSVATVQPVAANSTEKAVFRGLTGAAIPTERAPAVFRTLTGATDLAGAPRPTMRQQLAARCPDIGDPDLLRGGAALDGHGLCVRSVEQARSDAAAAAVVEGFGLLGLPYSRGRRGDGGYADCSSFIGRAYRRAGYPLSTSDWEPSSSTMRNAPWARVVDEALPGDILWRRGHVAMALADGFMMHASQPGDVTHVRQAGRYSAFLAVELGF